MFPTISLSLTQYYLGLGQSYRCYNVTKTYLDTLNPVIHTLLLFFYAPIQYLSNIPIAGLLLYRILCRTNCCVMIYNYHPEEHVLPFESRPCQSFFHVSKSDVLLQQLAH